MPNRMSANRGNSGAGRIAAALHQVINATYDIIMVVCGQVLVEHESLFGNLRESGLESAEAVAVRLASCFHDHLRVFETASTRLALFNEAFTSLRNASGFETAGQQLAGYLLKGPIDSLLRALRCTFSSENISVAGKKELCESVSARTKEVENLMELDSDEDRASIYALADILKEGKHGSLEQVMSSISITSGRRDIRALIFVALAIAGWEPDLEGWEKHMANLIRGENAVSGKYHLPMHLEHNVRNDILVATSVERQDTYMTLNGLVLQRVETLHTGQNSEGRYVRSLIRNRPRMVGPLWAPYSCTANVEWDTVKDFVAHTEQMTFEWASIINRLHEIGIACAHMNGTEVGRAFLTMANNIKLGSPGLHKIWEKTLSQRSFTALVTSAKSFPAARAAIVERMALSTVTECSIYHIYSSPIYLRVKGGTAYLYDKEGKQVYVDEFREIMRDEDATIVAGKFFALLTRAMEGWTITSEFYKERSLRQTLLCGKALSKGFYRLHAKEKQSRSSQEWEQLGVTLFGGQG